MRGADVIAASLRASAWRYSTITLAVCAALAVAAALYFRGSAAVAGARADAATGRAETLAGELAEARKAQARDDASSDATTDARQSAADRSADHDAREQRVRTIVRERQVPVPAVCPGPDADILRESADASVRLRAAEDRLRGIGRAANQAPE